MSVVSDIGGLPGFSQPQNPQNPPAEGDGTTGVEETGNSGGSGAANDGAAQSGQSGNTASGNDQTGSAAQPATAAADVAPATSDATSESVVTARVETPPLTIDGARAFAEAAQNRAVREGLVEQLSNVAQGWNDPVTRIDPAGEDGNTTRPDAILPGPGEVIDTNPL